VFVPAQKIKEKDLSEKYQKWLRLTKYIIHGKELDVFMQLTNERERDIFIESFWNLRDPTPGTPQNERKDEIIERFEYANYRLGSGSGRDGWMTDQGRIYIILGPPASIERTPSSKDIYPNEIWSYYGDVQKGLPSHFTLVFFRRSGAGELKLYDPVSDGPASLLIFRKESPNIFDYQTLYERIFEVAPILALSSLSYIPGELTMGYQPSMDSPFILANILEYAKNQVTPTYATHFLDYKGIVDTEYMTNFVESEARIDVIKDPVSGLNFLHFSILPSEISVDYYEPNDQYYSDLRIDVSLRVQDNIIFQYTKDFPLYFSDDDIALLESTGITVEDTFPLADGEYKFIVLLQNSVAKEFSIIERDIFVSENLGQPKISGPFLGFEILNLDESYFIPYKLLDKKLAVDPKDTFGVDDEIVYFFNIENLTKDLWEGGEIRVTIKGFAENPYEKSYRIDLNAYTFNKTLFISQSLPASEFPPDYYDLKLSFVDKDGTLVDENNEEFIISPLKKIAHPNPKIKGVPFQNQFIYFYMLAQQYENLNKEDKAEENYARAYSMRPNYLKGLIDYSNFLLKINKFEQSLELIEKVEDIEEQRFSYFLIKGKSLMGLGRYAEAIVELLEGNKIYNSELSLLNSLGFCYYKTEEKEKALDILYISLSLNPNQEYVRSLIKEIEK